MIPGWILDAFAAIMLVVAALSAGRLAVGGSRLPGRPIADMDAAHVLMGVAMAGMLARSLHTLPNTVWVVVFAIVTLWFGCRVAAALRAQGAAALGTGHYLPHFVHGAAMVYMYAAVNTAAHGSPMGVNGTGAASGSMGRLEIPTLGLAFVLFLAAWAVWDLDQIGSAHLHAHGAVRLPRLGFAPQPAVALATPGAAAPGAGPARETARPAGPAPGRASPAPAPEPGGTSPPIVSGSEAASLLLDPRVAVTCRVAMGITMAFMLVIML